MARRHGGGGSLYNPRSVLSGRKLKRATRALTKLELMPAINSYKRQQSELERLRGDAATGLTSLGQRTGTAVAGAYDALEGAGNQNIVRQQALASMLNTGTQQVGAQAQQAVTDAQTGQLGGLTDALKSRNVDPGGSQAQAALAAQAQAAQERQAATAQANSQFAQAQGGAWQGLASGQQMAGQSAGRAAQADVASLIASRIAASNSDYNSNVRDVLGKRMDTKALWGATKLKNLMNLRSTERTYLGAQASAGLDAAKLNETARHDRATEGTAQYKATHPSSGSSSSSSANFGQFNAAANNVINQHGVPVGAAGWSGFADTVSQQEGLSLNPKQKARWLRKYRAKHGY